ncbi:CAZyme family CE10 [Penicillium taxi]|uniref:CAZyme family CE10 n=1 Tax=Penicillium taxi TaxID=168475 RepID=UPI0025451C85|nr:CAZyme family CE10 [Penicillium taxi]KAJ5894922.1 CAZyme family CE10 [Penicillium taxi]
METSRRPYLKSLAQRGFVQGVTISVPGDDGPDLCHYFGGVRYALPPSQRWRLAQPLPPTFTYGTQEIPGKCDGGAGVCPQPAFWDIAPENENEDAWTEDCFQCNVWVPIGEAPQDGWPVFIFIHGGWLQFGSPNSFNVAALIGETDFKCVIVMPAYRVNLFGFLYSAELELDAAEAGETVGNHGFWDQRLAMEWTKENIHLFSGNGSNITIAGYSAGANSVFHQLAYDLRQPDDQSIIRQACIWSNSPAVQPKYPKETQLQFNELLAALSISPNLPAAEKLSLLRSIPAKKLIDVTKTLEMHQFRPTSDTGFVSATLFDALDNGDFARKLLERNIRLILGECCDEHFVYSVWYPPKADTLPALRKRLIADYPERFVDALLTLHYPDGKLPSDCRDWVSDAWGKIYADMQVHEMQRGFIYALTSNTGGVDASRLLHRYRVEFRAKCVDKSFPPEWGVTHSSDYPLWFWGNGDVLSSDEKKIALEAFVGPLSRFVQGVAAGADEFGWNTSGWKGMRTLKSDGVVETREDPTWEQGVRVWKGLRKVDAAT